MSLGHYTERLARMSPDQLERLLGDDPARAAKWVAAAAAEGLVAAQVRLGRMLLDGKGVAQDPQAAFAWFVRAAEAGDLDARNMVGRCFENGWGVPQDYERAAAHFHLAAEAGYDWAQYNLGHLYLDGSGVVRDMAQAYAWYRRAAEQGHPRALSLLGRCLEEGWGCERDVAAALDCYRLSAQAGYFRGQYNYASLLLQQGAVEQAQLWFERAATIAPLPTRREIAITLLGCESAALQARGLAVLVLCCEAGEALDYFRYGRALWQGLGCEPDRIAARGWLAWAAALGFQPAIDHLANEGMGDVVTD